MRESQGSDVMVQRGSTGKTTALFINGIVGQHFSLMNLRGRHQRISCSQKRTSWESLVSSPATTYSFKSVSISTIFSLPNPASPARLW
ncbi:hypothetical protein AVEN_156419-1 [Araneus ventricosus]|uniref:Uncharacterized protein n=1 Tax=Araneus ventricosus TaxID=182803 RepID=A0A4Y2SVZ3_ARAVE|nr:hypothetical protein AVEN_156419-1 [Araneus ventricosus]